MPKLRFAIILPIVLLCTAFPVARWENYVQGQLPSKREYPYQATPTLIYRGVNAPAVFFETPCVTYLPIYRVDHAPPSFLGIGIEDLLFHPGVVVLWSIVGLVLDRRGRSSTRPKRKMTTFGVLLSILAIAFGIVFLWGGIIAVRHSSNSTNPFGNVLEGILFVAWAVVSALPPVLRLLRQVRVYMIDLDQSGNTKSPSKYC
jgi:hypothetical protein